MNEEQLEIEIYGDEVLGEKSRPIEHIDGEIENLARRMAESMYASKGIGLAANQVGRAIRLVVMDVDWPKRDEDDPNRQQPTTLINPEVIEEGAEDDVFCEGCLSVPGIEGDVWRPTWIRYRYRNLKGKQIEAEARDMQARCIMHEIDHLDGVLFVDRMLTEDRRRIAGQLAKLRKSRPAKTAPIK